MAVTYGFFDSINGDRLYNADQISNYFLKLISNGVFATPSSAMQVLAGSGMGVNVSAGWGFINCKWINNDALYSLTVDEPDVVLNRIDRVVLHLDPTISARSISIEIKKGTPAGTPTPPDLTRNAGGVWELSLAQIAVNAGATAISQADITDERADASVCGWVTGLIDQIDTTNLFAQFTAAFYDWFDEIKTEVKTTTIVMSYHSRYVTSGDDETTIPINIPEYNETLDILYVFINGLKLVPNVDYTLDGDGNVELTEALDVIGTPVEFEVLKSVDTSQAESIVTSFLNLVAQVNGINTRLTAVEGKVNALENAMGGLKLVKISAADFDNLSTKDVNTIYYVYDTDGKIIQYMGDAKLSIGTLAGNALLMLTDTLNGELVNATEAN